MPEPFAGLRLSVEPEGRDCSESQRFIKVRFERERGLKFIERLLQTRRAVKLFALLD